MGTNASVFNGSAFAPSAPNTAHISTLVSGAFTGVRQARTLEGDAALYNGIPVTPSASSSSAQTGTWPSITNSRTVSWTVSDATRISGYNLYVSVGGGGYSKVNSSLISGTSYTYGFIAASTDYNFYVQAVSPTGISVNSSAITARINTETQAVTLSKNTSTPSSVTYTATFTANTYQYIYFEYSGTGTYVQVPNSSSTSVDFSRTGLSERTGYAVTARGVTKNGHFTTQTASFNIDTTNAAPPAPATPSAVEVTPAGGQPGTTDWTQVKRSMRITFTPAYDPIYQRTYVYYKRDDSGTWTEALNTTSGSSNQTVTIDNLSPRYSNIATTWQFFIRQYDTEGLYTDSGVGSTTVSAPNPYSVAYWYDEATRYDSITEADLGSDASGADYSAINASDTLLSTYWRSGGRSAVLNIYSTDAPWYRGSIGSGFDYIYIHSIRLRLPYSSSSHGVRVACRWRDTGTFFDPGWNQYYIGSPLGLTTGHFAIVNPSGTAWTTIPVGFSMDRGTSYGVDGYKDFYFTVFDLDRDPPTATTGNRYAMLAEVQFTYDVKRRGYATYFW